MTVGITVQATLKTMKEGPSNNAGPPPEAQPAPNTPPPPKETDDEIISTALAELDKKDKADLSVLDKLDKVKPNQRRAEVGRKLVVLLDTKEPSPRVIKTLGIWGGPEEVPALVALFDHRLYFTRDEAMRSVGHLRDTRGIAPLVARLKDNTTAQDALIEIGPACESDLIPLIDPKVDFGILQHVLAVLKKVGTSTSVPALKVLAAKAHVSVAEPTQKVIDAIEARSKTPPKQ
jgi:HEAT repeat protein